MVVGIDFGMIYLVVFVFDDFGCLMMLDNVEGDKFMFSVFFFEGVNVIVGKEVVKVMGMEMERIVECLKCDLGLCVYYKVFGDR